MYEVTCVIINHLMYNLVLIKVFGIGTFPGMCRATMSYCTSFHRTTESVPLCPRGGWGADKIAHLTFSCAQVKQCETM